MTEQANPLPIPEWLAQILARPITHGLLGAAILLLDQLTGPYLLFPVLFVVPVSLAAWYCGARIAYMLAVLLPLGRLVIALKEGADVSPLVPVVNAATRIAVLLFLAFLVSRLAHQTRMLQSRVADLVRICAWSRTIEYEGEWVSFEEYLKRRFNIEATHGIAPGEAARLVEKMRGSAPPRGS